MGEFGNLRNRMCKDKNSTCYNENQTVLKVIEGHEEIEKRVCYGCALYAHNHFTPEVFAAQSFAEVTSDFRLRSSDRALKKGDRVEVANHSKSGAHIRLAVDRVNGMHHVWPDEWNSHFKIVSDYVPSIVLPLPSSPSDQEWMMNPLSESDPLEETTAEELARLKQDEQRWSQQRSGFNFMSYFRS